MNKALICAIETMALELLTLTEKDGPLLVLTKDGMRNVTNMVSIS
jgi:hypothetical protein